MEFTAEEGKAPRSHCSTLILPALSIGNVGQLAVDLLVSSSRADRIGYLDDPYVLPCVGNDAYGPEPRGDLAVALEVFEDSENNLSIIQQRAPIMKGMTIKFAKNISSWAAAIGKKEVVIVSSLDSGKMPRCDMIGQQIHYISTGNVDGTDERCENLGWKKLEQYVPSQRGWQYLDSQLVDGSVQDESFWAEDDLTDEDYFPSLPFASLFSSCKAKGLKVTCLFCFCSEGDNMQDALLLAEAVYKFIGKCSSTSLVAKTVVCQTTHQSSTPLEAWIIHSGQVQVQGNRNTDWAIPLSWKTVYGPPPDMSMF